MKYMQTSPIFKIVILFIFWRFLLIAVLLWSIQLIPLGSSDRFLGGGPANYHYAPEIFAWANFDGEHYLSIAAFGYKQFEQAFFPIYPMLISVIARIIPIANFSVLLNLTLIGLLISNISFVIALIGLFKLISIDFSKKLALMTILLYLLFPTSFYFGSVYNESLFLLLSVWAFYFARKDKWLLAAIFGFFASATRVFGFLLLPSLLLEAYLQRKKILQVSWIILIPLGLVFYMVYQGITVGDPFAFYHLQERVGPQHQQGIILLPQVYYRYFKILFSIQFNQPIYQTIILEFIVGILFFILPIYGYFKKLRLSYLLYAMVGFLLPTVQGSFSSLPRYVLVLFPSFLIMSLWLNGIYQRWRILILFSLSLMLLLETTLFLRGYWIA